MPSYSLNILKLLSIGYRLTEIFLILMVFFVLHTLLELHHKFTIFPMGKKAIQFLTKYIRPGFALQQ